MSDYLLSAPIPPDGRLQVWYVDPTGLTLLTRWKATSDPRSQWTAPAAPFNPPPPPAPFPPVFFDMTAGVLPDGRTQIWGIASGTNNVLTSWKVSTAHDSLWSGWSPFDTSPITATGSVPIGIAVAALPDKRLQLFIMDSNINIWTAWKTTAVPNAPWNPLTLL